MHHARPVSLDIEGPQVHDNRDTVDAPPFRTYRSLILRKAQLYFIASVFALRLLLDISYTSFVSPLFSYAGMFYVFEWSRLVESYVVLAILALLSPYRLQKPSDFFYCFSLVMYFLPMGLFYAYAGVSPVGFYIINLCAFALALSLYLPSVVIKKPKISTRTVRNLLLLAYASMTMLVAALVGVENINFDLAKEYEYRPVISNILSGYGLEYLIPWTISVIGPAVLSDSLARLKFFLFLILSALHVFWFGITSHKTPMFIPVMVLGIWWLFSGRNELFRVRMAVS